MLIQTTLFKIFFTLRVDIKLKSKFMSYLFQQFVRMDLSVIMKFSLN